MKRKVMVLVSMLLLVLVSLNGCGRAKTLEEYLSENPSEQEVLDQVGAEMADMLGIDMDIDVEGNDIIYTYTLEEIPAEEEAKMAKSSLEKAHDQMNTAAQTVIESVEEELKISGVTMRMIYMDQEGNEFFSYIYE